MHARLGFAYRLKLLKVVRVASIEAKLLPCIPVCHNNYNYSTLQIQGIKRFACQKRFIYIAHTNIGTDRYRKEEE